MLSLFMRWGKVKQVGCVGLAVAIVNGCGGRPGVRSLHLRNDSKVVGKEGILGILVYKCSRQRKGKCKDPELEPTCHV